MAQVIGKAVSRRVPSGSQMLPNVRGRVGRRDLNGRDALGRVPIESIPGEEAERIYLAVRLKEAQAIEALLTRVGVYYAVRVEPFRGSGLLSSFFEYNGAMFYVRSDQAVFCRERLEAGGFSDGIVRDDS